MSQISFLAVCIVVFAVYVVLFFFTVYVGLPLYRRLRARFIRRDMVKRHIKENFK